MDPLTLLRELFGEEPIRKMVTSGFDSVHKIAAATPESLSFFSGINEVMARQIVASAEESLSGPPSAAYRDSLTGSAEGESAREPARPVRPRVPPHAKPPAPPSEKVAPPPDTLLDESPLLDAGGILKSVAREPRPKEFMDEGDLLDEVGLSDAEVNFLEGISPWPGGTSRKEKTASAPLDARPSSFVRAPGAEEKEIEYAPISDWSPEKDPDPTPRLVRAPELSAGSSPAEEPETTVEISADFGRPEAAPQIQPETAPQIHPEASAQIQPEAEFQVRHDAALQAVPPEGAARESAGPAQSEATEAPSDKSSFWKFGK